MLKILSLLTITVLFAACSSNEKDSKKTAQKSHEQINIQPITDAKISNSVMTANTEEMNLSILGKEKANNSQVKAFAKKMLQAHTMHSEKTLTLVEKNQLMPKETKSSMEMISTSEAKIDELKRLEGSAFDKAFMTAQIKIHESLLVDLDTTLIPNAQNGELIAFLNETRATVNSHLIEAKNINESIL